MRILPKLALVALLFAGCAHVKPVTAYTAPSHPLDPLSPSEIEATFEVVRAHFAQDVTLPKEPLLYPMLALVEPDKQQVLAWRSGESYPRHAEAQVLHAPSNRTWLVEVDVQTRHVVKVALTPPGTQPPLTADEYELSDYLVRDYEPWQRAMRARGLEPAFVYLDGWAVGETRLADEVAEKLPYGHDTRLMRVLSFYRGAKDATGMDSKRPHNPYDRPIEGVVVTIDLNARQVLDMTDSGVRALSRETGNANTAISLRPLRTTETKDSDIQVDGHQVRWHGWEFRAVMHPREGLVLYDVRYRDHDVLRPVAYRMSLSEIYVPYGFDQTDWRWRGAFDVGEYSAGKLTQTLETGRDVPEHAKFLDSILFAEAGPNPANVTGSLTVPHSIALYERNNGMLWTRADPSSGGRDTRMARELVTTWSCWIGNYIYAFDWIFKLDGSLEVRTHLNGTTLNRGTDAQPEASAPKIGKDDRGTLVSAPNHQHFLNFRLDLDVDGPNNQVMEMEAAHVPGAPGTAFDATMAHLESEGARDVNPFGARHWHIESASRTNAFGKPTSFALEPGEFAVPYPAADAEAPGRGAFAYHQAWFTRYQPSELYAGGAFPNQAKRADGLSTYVTPPERIHGQDVVLWYTTGFTHLSKPEDHPVMSRESVGFRLTPRGFFDRNPALEVLDQKQ